MLKEILQRIPAGALVLIVVLLATAAAAVLILTNADLGREADVASLPPEDALEVLSERTDPLPPAIAYFYAQKLAEDGQTDRASEVLIELETRVGATEATLSARADLALVQGDKTGALSLLTSADTVRVNPDRVRRRIALARHLQDLPAERAAFEVLDPATLAPAEALRLADVFAWDGASQKLDELAVTRIQLNQADAHEMARRLSISGIAQGNITSLASAVPVWVSDGTAEPLLDAIMPVLTAAPNVAQQLANTLGNYDPSLRPLLVRAFARGGLSGSARGLLSDHLEGRSSLGPEQWDIIAYYSDYSGDLSILEYTLLDHEGDDVPAKVFLPVVRYQGAAGLTPWRNRIRPSDLDALPMLDAARNLLMQRPDVAAARLTDAARQAQTMSARDKSLWLSLADSLSGSGQLQQLRAMANSDPDLARMFSGTDD